MIAFIQWAPWSHIISSFPWLSSNSITSFSWVMIPTSNFGRIATECSSLKCECYKWIHSLIKNQGTLVEIFGVLDLGDLDIGNLRMCNEVMLAKCFWCFPLELNALWHRVIVSKCGLHLIFSKYGPQMFDWASSCKVERHIQEPLESYLS